MHCRGCALAPRWVHAPSTASPQLPSLFARHAGGSGKTTMAVRLYNRVSQAFSKRAIVRLDAGDTQEKMQQHLARMLKRLGAKDAAELLTRLQGLLGAGPVLLCVDNAWTAAQLDGLLPCGLLTSFQPGSRLIVTSRFAELRDSASYWVSVSQCLSCWVTQGLTTRTGMPDGWHLRKHSIQQHLAPTGYGAQAPGPQARAAERRSIAPAVPAVRWLLGCNGDGSFQAGGAGPLHLWWLAPGVGACWRVLEGGVQCGRLEGVQHSEQGP